MSDVWQSIVNDRSASAFPVLDSFDEAPEDAGRAMELARHTGDDPNYIYGDLEHYERQKKSEYTEALIRNNKFLASYIDSDPLAAKVSHNDIGRLDEITSALHRFGPTSILAAAAKGFAEGFGPVDQGWGEWMSSRPEDKAFIDAHPGLAQFGRMLYQDPMVKLMVNGPEILMRGFSGALKAGESALIESFTQAGMDPSTAKRTARELIAIPEMKMNSGEVAVETRAVGQRLVDLGIKPTNLKELADAWTAGKPYIMRGEEPPVGIHPLFDELHKEQAKVDAKNFDEVNKVVNAAQTKEISVEHAEKYLKLHPEATEMAIPVEAVKRIYGDKPPLPDDKMLGWVPNIAEQIRQAEHTGGDIEFSSAEFHAKVDPEFYKEIRDDLRFRSNGFTLNEIKDLAEIEKAEKEAQAKVEAEAPPPAEPVETAPVSLGERPEQYRPWLVDRIQQAVDSMRHGLGWDEPITEPLMGAFPLQEPKQFKLRGSVEGDTVGSAVQSIGSTDLKGALTSLDLNPLSFVQRGLPQARFVEAMKGIMGKMIEKGGDTPVHVVRDVDWKALSGGGFAHYDPVHHHIVIPETSYYSVAALDHWPAQTIIHEGLHAVTVRALGEVPAFKANLRAVMDDILKARPELADEYGFTNEKEFITESWTNPRFHGEILRHRIEPDLARRLGIEDWRKATGFDYILHMIRHYLRLDKSAVTALEAVTKVTEEAMEHKIRPETEAVYERLAQGLDLAPSKIEEPFESGAMGMNKPMTRQLRALIEKKKLEDLKAQEARGKLKETIRQGAEWKRLKADMKDEVVNDITSRPDIAASLYFNGYLFGKKLDKKPKMNFKGLTKEQIEGVSPKVWGRGGQDPEFVARTFGYPTVGALLDHLRQFEKERGNQTYTAHINRLVDEEVDNRMEYRYGDLDENILEEAQDHVLGQTQMDELHEQTLAMAHGGELKTPTDMPFTKDNVKAWVEDMFEASRVGAISVAKYLRYAGKAGKVVKALLDKQPTEALKAQQMHYYGAELAREANRFTKEQKKNDRRVRRFTNRDGVEGVPDEYTSQIQRMLASVGYTLSRTEHNLRLALDGKPDLAGFIAEKNAEGAGILDPGLGHRKKDIKDFTVGEYRDFMASLESMEYAGRQEQILRTALKEVDWNEAKEKIVANLDSLAKAGFDPKKKGTIAFARRMTREVDARLIKMEQLIDWIDKNDAQGPMNQPLRYLFDQQHKKGDHVAKIAADLAKIPVDRDWGLALNNLVNNTILRDETGNLAKLTNENKIVIALNFGNESNRDVMVRGHNWNVADIHAFLDRNMSDMDWDFVQAVWKVFDGIAPELIKATTLRSGIPIEMIPPSGFDTSMHGRIEGGWYPLVKDPTEQLLGKQRETDLVNKPYFNPLPMARTMKERTGVAYPLDLSLSPLANRINETLHAVYMQDAVRQAWKVVKDPEIRQGIAKAFGPEYVKQMDAWLKDIANNGGENARDWQASWVSRNMRENVVFGLMGYKVTTALIHGGSALVSSAYEMGGIHHLAAQMKELGIAQALPDVSRRFFANPAETFKQIDWALETFPELRNRQRAIGRDMQAQLANIVSKGFVDDVARMRSLNLAWSMKFVAFLDQLTATPVAIAAYRKGIAEGLSHEEAVYAGEKAVRNAHGSASLVARANIGRGELNKWLTIAYNGYWNHNYNRLRSAARDVRNPELEISQRLMTGSAALTALVIAPAIVHHAIRGNQSSTPGQALADSLISQFGGTVPIVNTLTYAAIHQTGRTPSRDVHLSPADLVFEKAFELYHDTWAKTNGKKAELWLKHAVETPGYFVGLGGSSQIADTLQFNKDVMTGRVRPKSMLDWARGELQIHPDRPRRRK